MSKYDRLLSSFPGPDGYGNAKALIGIYNYPLGEQPQSYSTAKKADEIAVTLGCKQVEPVTREDAFDIWSGATKGYYLPSDPNKHDYSNAYGSLFYMLDTYFLKQCNLLPTSETLGPSKNNVTILGDCIPGEETISPGAIPIVCTGAYANTLYEEVTKDPNLARTINLFDFNSVLVAFSLIFSAIVLRFRHRGYVKNINKTPRVDKGIAETEPTNKKDNKPGVIDWGSRL